MKNNIIAGIATTSIETVLDPTKHWLDLFGGNMIKDVMDCYLEFNDVHLSVPGQVGLDICPKVIDGL